MTDQSNSQAALITFVERVERINKELKTVQADRSEIYKEAVLHGYDLKALKKIVKDRQQEPEEIDEFEALVRTYREAMRG